MKVRPIRLFLCLVLPTACLIVVSLWIFLGQGSGNGPPSANEALMEEDLEFAEIRRMIMNECIVDLDTWDFLNDSLTGMIRSIPHASFYPVEERFQQEISGEFSGLGLILIEKGERLLVARTLFESPAAKYFEPGDEILEIDGMPARSLTPESALKKTRGEKDAICRVTVRKRKTAEAWEHSLPRRVLVKPSVSGIRYLDRQAGIAYLRISRFLKYTGNEFIHLLDGFEQGGLKSLVLDLRFNGGGILDPAVKIANLFIAEGILVTTRGRNADSTVVHSASRSYCLYPDLKLVVLINGGTASAAEALAGALQEHGRARLMGTRTLGKGVIQEAFKKKIGGRIVRIQIPTARFFLPSGRCIDRHLGTEGAGGIEPDLQVSLRGPLNKKLEKYLDEIVLSWDTGLEKDDRWKGLFPDPQIEAALRLLRKEGSSTPSSRNAEK